MTALDTKLVPKALSMIDKFGKDLSFSEDAALTYDPSTGSVSGDAPTVFVRKASPPMAYDREYIDGVTVLTGDVKTLIAASGLAFTPVVGMLVTFDSTSWNIMRVSPLYSGDLIAVYELQMRQ